MQPREEWGRHSRRTQLERFGDVRHPEPVGAALERSTGSGHSAVAVAVGLDDNHRVVGGRRLPEVRHVGRKRNGIDESSAQRLAHRDSAITLAMANPPSWLSDR